MNLENKVWSSVRDSLENSVWNSVCDTVRNCVHDTLWDSIEYSDLVSVDISFRESIEGSSESKLNDYEFRR